MMVGFVVIISRVTCAIVRIDRAKGPPLPHTFRIYAHCVFAFDTLNNLLCGLVFGCCRLLHYHNVTIHFLSFNLPNVQWCERAKCANLQEGHPKNGEHGHHCEDVTLAVMTARQSKTAAADIEPRTLGLSGHRHTAPYRNVQCSTKTPHEWSLCGPR